MTDPYENTAEAGELLVIGVRGTLEPDAGTQVLGAGERLSGEELPPLLEELLLPWLSRAVRDLGALRRGLPPLCGAEPVPLDDLLSTLKLRLAELMEQAAGEWLSSMAGRGGAAFWRAYPGLRPVVAGAVRDWAAGTASFLARLTADDELLAERMGLPALPAVVSVAATAADLHPGGGFAVRIGFAGGGCASSRPKMSGWAAPWRSSGCGPRFLRNRGCGSAFCVRRAQPPQWIIPTFAPCTPLKKRRMARFFW